MAEVNNFLTADNNVFFFFFKDNNSNYFDNLLNTDREVNILDNKYNFI